MRAIVVATIICALATTLCGPAFAEVDLLHGAAQQGEVQIGLYSPNTAGNMDNVREYDGRVLDPFSLEYLSSLGYSGPWQYHVLGRYLFSADMDAVVGVNYRNRFGLTYKTSTLTHRLEARRAGNIALLSGPYTVTKAVDPPGTRPTIPVPDPNVNPGIDDNPDQAFAIARTVKEVSARFTPEINPEQALRLVASSWVQDKDGIRQGIGRWSSDIPAIDPFPRTRKHVFAVPVHTETSQSTVGGDVRVGQVAVINYRYSDTRYGQGSTPNITNVSINSNNERVESTRHLTQTDSVTKTSTVKARATINSRLFFNGAYTNRRRGNNAQAAGMRIDSGNAALTYLATDSLTLTARYRTTNQSSHTTPATATEDGELKVVNNALNTKLKSSLFEATYSGIPHAFVKLGYERKDVDRSTQLTADEFAEMATSSNSNILTGSIRYYPTTNLSISANAANTKMDRAGYAGTPNNRTQLNANATYMISDTMAVYGDLSHVNEDNNLVRPGPIPTTGEDPRKDYAGQGYENKMTTSTLGAWYSLNSKLVMDANYSNIKTDSANLWILGLDANAANNTDPNMVSYNTRNHQWSSGLTYSMSPKWSLYGRYILSNSNGTGVLDPTKYPQHTGGPDNRPIGPTWLPIDLRQHTYVLGFSHDLTAKDRLMLDFSVSEYVDRLNSTNTGAYDIWRLGWSRQF